MLLRIGNMRGVDLALIDTDFDLTWNALFLTPEGRTLGRFGGRDADTPAKYHTLGGLKHSLTENLKRFRAGDRKPPKPLMPIYAEDYPAADKLPANACIHCHHVNEFRREFLRSRDEWSLENAWVYPQPENLGLTIDPEQGNRVTHVQPNSSAAKAGISAKSLLTRVAGQPIAAVMDLQYALHQSPKAGKLEVAWHDGEREHRQIITLSNGWRMTDVSWRWSLKTMAPNPGIIGDDLDADSRKSLGLMPKQLAYRHMNFLTPAARHAGLQANDIIVGLNDQALTMTARQFETHIRLHHRVGDELSLNVLRGKAKLKLKLKLGE